MEGKGTEQSVIGGVSAKKVQKFCAEYCKTDYFRATEIN